MQSGELAGIVVAESRPQVVLDVLCRGGSTVGRRVTRQPWAGHAEPPAARLAMQRVHDRRGGRGGSKPGANDHHDNYRRNHGSRH